MQNFISSPWCYQPVIVIKKHESQSDYNKRLPLYIGILFGAHPILHISRIRIKLTTGKTPRIYHELARNGLREVPCPLNTDCLKLQRKKYILGPGDSATLWKAGDSDPTEYPYKEWPPTLSWPPGVYGHTWQPPPARPQRHSISLSLSLFFWRLSLCIIALLDLENGSDTHL
jgi:hypothetical protein